MDDELVWYKTEIEKRFAKSEINAQYVMERHVD